MSGAYLTRFEDYYKSSDESGDESDDAKEEFGSEKYGPGVEKSSPEAEEYDESGDDERMDDGMVDNKADSDWTPEERDWVPQSLVDLKLKIKFPKNFKGYDEDAFNDEVGESEDEGSRVYSNDYSEVCKFKCVICGLDIDTEKLKSHMNSNHDTINGNDGESKRAYDVKTWHRCGICGKAVLFTRVRLRYHVITEHSMAIQDYNEEYMIKRGGRVGRPVGWRGRRPSGVGSETGEGEADVDPTTVRQEDISNDYADIVKVECKICSKRVEKDNFRFMHLKQHGMDLADYKLVYGDPVVVKSSFHKCHICEQIFVFSRSRLASHLAKHKVSVKEYGRKFLTKVKSDRSYSSNLQIGEIDKDCMFSNDYEDECSTICKICERSLNYGNLGSHLYQSHSTRMKDYVEQWGEPQITKKSYHECAICHETLLFIRYHLVTHVKTKHNLSIAVYNKSHMQLHNVEYCDSNILDKGRKIGTQKAPQWCDGTMYKCPYCFNIYYRYFTFRIHLINSHKMTDSEERSTCVRENEILTDIYRCKICSTQVKRDRMDIEAHLKQAHKTTLKIYSANFENPDCKDDPKEIVARLVRMGVLEEPSDKMCKTPKKLKMRTSEIKSLKPVIKKEKLVPVKQPVRGDKSKQDYKAPKAGKFDSEVSASDKAVKTDNALPNGGSTAFSSPIKKMKIPKIKREVESEVSNEFNSENIFRGLEREVVTDSTDTENESYHSSKRKRKLPSKFSEDFEVSLNKSNIPQRPKPVTNSVSPKKSKLSQGSTASVASPLSQRTPSNTPKSRHTKASTLNNSGWSTSQPSPARNPEVGGLTQLQRLSSGSGGGGVSSPGKGEDELNTSVGGFSSPGRFGHIKTENTSPRPVTEDNIVYRCPLYPCAWTCGKEGMRQGPAVLHLLRVHKIQPLEMRERGIKFDKIQA
eukprot:GFUD01043750.1.p1 GENE.GFUD01043750.1~~GFUD01043750.1.p1  ORF type:complete len:921 (+),score=245.54 GFUD01043750.1:150-2912(+)